MFVTSCHINQPVKRLRSSDIKSKHGDAAFSRCTAGIWNNFRISQSYLIYISCCISVTVVCNVVIIHINFQWLPWVILLKGKRTQRHPTLMAEGLQQFKIAFWSSWWITVSVITLQPPETWKKQVVELLWRWTHLWQSGYKQLWYTVLMTCH